MTGIRFNKTVFCTYQAISDDLMYWAWFDVLFLSICYGLDSTTTSLVFSVSFWVALLVKIPGNLIAKRLGAGHSVILAAFLFLMAAIILTFGRTIIAAIIGESIYLIAKTFQEMSTVIIKNVAKKDPLHIDYAKIMSASVFFASPFWKKLQNKNGNSCISKMAIIASMGSGARRRRINPMQTGYISYR